MTLYLHDHDPIGKHLSYLLKHDAVFKPLSKRDDLFRWKRNAGRFSDMAEMIVSQQISVKAADSIFAKLKENAGGVVTAERVLKLSEKKLRLSGLSFQKIDYLTGLAEAVESKRFKISALQRMSDDEVIEAITSLKGFGLWSAQMYLIFSMARPDIWPYGDLGVQNGIKLYKGDSERMKPKEILEWGNRFENQRTSAALLLWKVKDVNDKK
jgi:DNA-3-methyladenine glycosylase II